MCPLGSSSRVRAREGSQVIPGTGASVGLEGGRKSFEDYQGAEPLSKSHRAIENLWGTTESSGPLSPEV